MGGPPRPPRVCRKLGHRPASPAIEPAFVACLVDFCCSVIAGPFELLDVDVCHWQPLIILSMYTKLIVKFKESGFVKNVVSISLDILFVLRTPCVRKKLSV